jgi:uncharacterized membrane protein (UPF0127 family)
VGVAIARSLALAGLLIACEGPPVPNATPPAEAGWITIAGQRVALEIARTREEQSLGLGERDALAWNRGMLFVYDEPGFPRFWMKGMRFDIDIVWIRQDQISEISHRVPHVPGQNGPIVAPQGLTDRVLEVPAGYAQSHGWRVGQRVQIEVPPSRP